jgi:two-component system, cell cycle sensor histidine kinase and response regulator CckA
VFLGGGGGPPPDGVPVGTVCVLDRVARDLTPAQTSSLADLARQVEAQLELRRLSREVRGPDRFFELSLDAMCIAGIDGYFQRVNPAFERMLDYTADELVSRPYLDFVHPEDVPKTTAEATQLAGGEHPTARFENRYRARDGSYRSLAWTSVTVPVEGRIYAIARDVTDIMELQAQLLQAKKMEAVGRFASAIAHDFNNVLAVVLGFGHLLRAELGEGSPQREDIDEIVNAAERGIRLTRELLLWARKPASSPAPLDVSATVNDLSRAIRQMVGTRIEISTALTDEPCFARIESTHLEQILTNLVANARDAMPDGGALFLQTSNVLLSDRDTGGHPGVAPGRYVVLRVSDTGAGMDAATQERIFELFFTTKEPGSGTGLGLSTVFALVTAAGGEVAVESEVRAGTTIRVYLPGA